MITGSYGNEMFAVPFTEDRYNQMMALYTSSLTITSGAEMKALLDEFKKLTEGTDNTLAESEIPGLHISSNGKYYLAVSAATGVQISSIPMPSALVDKIKTAIDQGLSADPLIKFWTRFLRNPKLRKLKGTPAAEEFANRVFNYISLNFTNNEQVQKLMNEKGLSYSYAEELSTVPQVQITTEGLLKTYKVSREIDWKYILDEKGEPKKVDRFEKTKTIDEVTGLVTYKDPEGILNEQRLFEPAVQGQGGDAFYCADTLGHVIKVGQVHRLPDWSYVNTDDKRSCVKGLHVGGLYYIQGYQNAGTETHNILVDPMHIGAVPDDNTGAIRVLSYYVLDAFSGVNGSIYHSSHYGAINDSEWATMKQSIIDEFGKLISDSTDSATKEINEISAI